MDCATLLMIVSIASIHMHTDRHYNQFNPGVSAACNHVEAGVYYNSLKKLSIHMDYRGSWWIAGIVTGYKPLPIVPDVAVYKDVGNVEFIGMVYPEFDNKKHIDNIGAVVGLRYKFNMR